jgi:hypothetical protein
MFKLFFAEEQIRERKEKEEYEKQSSYAIHRELVITRCFFIILPKIYSNVDYRKKLLHNYPNIS